MCRSILVLSAAFGLAAGVRAQERFDTPEAAVEALIESSAAHDGARLQKIFGPQGAAILTSGNPGQDQAEQAEFARLARDKQILQLDPRNPNRAMLSVGAEDWPFPVPLTRAKGKWQFDAPAGQSEMAARRIGTNELDAIEICAGFVEAQHAYAAEDREKDGIPKFASHMRSEPGRHNGLFEAATANPLVPQALADATWEGNRAPLRPYHGYYFRILEAQGNFAEGGARSYLSKGRLLGGFGLVAWPAEYGVSGVRTFLVNQDGRIFEKDLGQSGPALIVRYDPDPSWAPVD